MFSPEQSAVVESWGQGMAVVAGAGCGKTTTLVEKCRALLSRDPSARFLAVSFTEKSTSDLQDKLSEKVPGFLRGKHSVTTIHGLCGALAREFPREAGLEGEEEVLSESQARNLWESVLERLWLGDLPVDVEAHLDRLLQREDRPSVVTLLERVRRLRAFGRLETLEKDDFGKSLWAVSAWVLDRYQRLKRREGKIDFDDLELCADRVLEDTKVQATLHQRYSLILIDEFQDTNPVQARILRRIARPDASNLCVVGDPKQSIYRFRDADVESFEAFCRQLPQQRALTWNFRCVPGIIAWVNAVCEPAFQASRLEYQSLVARREATALEPVLQMEDADPVRLAKWIKSERDAGTPLEDFALLLRRVRGSEKWLQALTSQGLPLAVGSGGLFWTDPRVRELVAFLDAWRNPQQTTSWAAFLSSPWARTLQGSTHEEFYSWLDSLLRLPPETQWQRWAEGQERLKQLNEKRLQGQLSPGQVLRELLEFSEVEEAVGVQVLGLWHRCEEASREGLSFDEWVDDALKAIDDGRREKEVPPPRALGLLPVMTLHAAKGLEFKRVILVDFAGPTRSPPAPLLYWARESGAYLASRDEWGDRTPKEPIEAGWRARELRASVAESKRLFYVAATRARDQLILAFPPAPDLSEKARKELESDPDSVFDRDDWRGWIERVSPAMKKIEFQETRSLRGGVEELSAEEDRRGASAQASRRPQWVRARHGVTEWVTLARCPRRYVWTYLSPPGVNEPLLQEKEPQNAARNLGTRVHAALERRDAELLREIQAEVGPQYLDAEKIIQWMNQHPALSVRHSAWPELGFEIPVAGEVVVGSMDRVVEMGPEKFWLLDFKFSERMHSAEELKRRYQEPMWVYAWALHRLTSPQIELQGTLVQFSPQGVQEVHLEFPSWVKESSPAWLESRAQEARELIEQVKKEKAPGHLPWDPLQAEARPGSSCAGCDWRTHCPEGN